MIDLVTGSLSTLLDLPFSQKQRINRAIAPLLARIMHEGVLGGNEIA